MTATERSIDLPGLRLAARCWGDPALPPLLALHGWLDNAASFELLAPKLAHARHVIALDLPGHGHAQHLPQGTHYHFVDYVRCVLAVAEALQLRRFDLLGHSLGAGVASLAAAAAPQRVGRLLLIEGLGPIGDDGSRTLKRWQDALADTATTTRPLRTFNDPTQAVEARSRASGLAEALAKPIIDRALIATDGGWRWRSDPRLTRPTALRIAETQIHALLRGIEAPTALLLALPNTPYLPSEPMARRAGCVRDIEVRHLAGGHHLHLEHPHVVADWALAHLGDAATRHADSVR